VDDNADLALTTMMLLKHKKYEAHYCLSGGEALEAVERLDPDAVLLDLGMPGMDGYETARRLRETPWGKHGLIVALSGYGQEDDKRRTLAAGFDGHLAKPINLALLTQVVEGLINPKS
jgi:CheY-like chemotaxis protein